jgi:tungstate transport system permease protein
VEKLTLIQTVLIEIFPVVRMSLFVSILSTLIASFTGIALGIPVSLKNFRFKRFLMRVTDTLMSIPPVLMGLIVYLMLSRRGPLGELQLLFTPVAMIIAQTLLIIPIVFGLTVATLSKTAQEVKKTCLSIGGKGKDIFVTIISECKIQILTLITVAFGRAISEVGAVMMVGGNIKGHTRVMTTFIALETGKGNFAGAITIGIILLIISFFINFMLHRTQGGQDI